MTQPNPNEPYPEDILSGDANRPHKPADDREVVYFDGSPLLRGEIGMVFLCTLAAIAFVAMPVAIRYFWPGTLPVWGWFVFFALAALSVIIPILAVRSLRYRISNYRIDCERGILSKRIDTLELWHVEDIEFYQSLLDRILNVGQITVISHDETTPKLQLKGLPNPRPIFESVKQRIIAVKRQRGVIKMDIG